MSGKSLSLCEEMLYLLFKAYGITECRELSTSEKCAFYDLF